MGNLSYKTIVFFGGEKYDYFFLSPITQNCRWKKCLDSIKNVGALAYNPRWILQGEL